MESDESPLPAIWSRKVVGATEEPLRILRRPSWDCKHAWVFTVSMGSLVTSPCGNLRLMDTM